MAALDDRELSLVRRSWRGRYAALSDEDRIKVGYLISSSLPFGVMEKQAGVLSWFLGRGARAAAPAAEAVGAGTAAAAKGPYLDRIIQSWRDMGTPGAWMQKHLGGLAGPAAKAMKYTMFPGGPLLTGYMASQGNLGPVSTLSGLVGPMATLPLGPAAWIPEMLFGMFGAPKVDEWLGWKPVQQREYEAYNTGAQQGISTAMANAPVAPGASVPAPGAFYQPTLAYSPLGQMQMEEAGRILRGGA
jgi:hypothetical protein